MTRPNIPESVLKWREGDEITELHLEALAAFVVYGYGGDEAEMNRRLAELKTFPYHVLAHSLASLAGAVAEMDLETFVREFPNTATDDESLSTQVLLSTKFKRKALDD